MARCRVNGSVHATGLSMSPGKRDSIFRNSQYDRFAGVLAERSSRSLQRQSEGSPAVLPGAGDLVSYPLVSIHGETTFGCAAITERCGTRNEGGARGCRYLQQSQCGL